MLKAAQFQNQIGDFTEKAAHGLATADTTPWEWPWPANSQQRGGHPRRRADPLGTRPAGRPVMSLEYHCPVDRAAQRQMVGGKFGSEHSLELRVVGLAFLGGAPEFQTPSAERTPDQGVV